MNFLRTLIARIRGHLHVDGIAAAFHTAIARLEYAAQHHIEQEAAHFEAMKVAAENAAKARVEAVKASNLVKRLRALLEG